MSLYIRVWGPYINNDGRRIVIVKLRNGKKKTISYARYLLSSKLERELSTNEEADHVNGNILDDRIENIQLLTKGDNIRKSNKTLMINVICKQCLKLFNIPLRRYKRNQKTLRMDGPFCSKKCAGITHH